MNRRTFLKAIALGSLVVPKAARLHTSWAAPRQGASWTLVDLGDLNQGTQVDSQGLNNQGQVVGEAAFGTDAHAFRWDAGSIYDLGTQGGPNSVAYAVNDAGQIVGAADNLNGATHACLWQAGTTIDLGDLGYGHSVARAISSTGVIVGSVGRESQPFIWQNGTMTALDTSAGAAVGVNTNGLIVGYVYASGYAQACVWQNGERTGLFDRSPRPPLVSQALAVNEAGLVTGVLQETATDAGIGFLWDGVSLTRLPRVAEGGRSVNADGAVVGPDQLWMNGRVAHLATIVAQASGSAGWSNVLAVALNNAGQIAASGRRQDGARSGLLAQPRLIVRDSPVVSPSAWPGQTRLHATWPRTEVQSTVGGLFQTLPHNRASRFGRQPKQLAQVADRDPLEFVFRNSLACRGCKTLIAE